MKFVGAIIQNDKGEFLLQLRDEKAPSFPLCWTLFGGKVEEGETSEQAIWRELEEEIGLCAEMTSGLKEVQENVQENGAVQIIFHVKTKVLLANLCLKEGRKVLYVKKEDLLSRDFAFNIREVMQNFLEHKSQ